MKDSRIAEIEEFVQRTLCQVSGNMIAHDYKHVDRVRNWALRIAESEGVEDLAVVEACALLHDIGLAHVEDRAEHAEEGARIAARFLSENRTYARDEIAIIVDAIRYHSSPSGGGHLGVILRDADKLDAMGAVGLMRAFTSKHRFPEYDPHDITGDTWKMAMGDFEERFASGSGIGSTIVDQINFQISFFGALETKSAIDIAEPLAAFMRSFVRQLEEEITQGKNDT